jgi:hypothetical protein
MSTPQQIAANQANGIGDRAIGNCPPRCAQAKSTWARFLINSSSSKATTG